MWRIGLRASVAAMTMTNLGEGTVRKAPGIGETVPGAAKRMHYPAAVTAALESLADRLKR
jgi:hypothetical protein